MIQRLTPGDMTANRWYPLAQAISQRQKWVRPMKPEWFFPQIEKWLRLGLAEAWGSDDNKTLLIALFTPNAYTGEMGGMVFVWWSLSNGKTSNQMFNQFEMEARRRGCAHIYSSVFGEVRSEAINRLYRMKGFEPHEQVFRKFL